MSIQFPMPLDAFFRKLRVRSVTFNLGEASTQSGTADGEILTASRGDTLWGGKVVVGLNRDNDEAAALMDIVRQVGASFYISDPKRKWLKSHQGEALSASIAAVNAFDRRLLSLNGLSDGVELSVGDQLSFFYGVGLQQVYLGRVVAGGVVSGGTLDVSVLPFLPIGLTTGLAVSLFDPLCIAKYVPKSFEPITRLPGYDSGFSFGWRQTKR